MPIDRDAALKTAEKLLRQGKLDGAIEAYVRLVEDQPKDWSSINALGDLYLRAGDVDRAVVQFTRVADQLFTDGMLSKAAALYKKALKARGDHEHTLRQLAEIAARQGLTADARAYLRQLSAESHGRAQDAGVSAAQDASDSPQTAALMQTTVDDLERQGRRREALDLLLSLARTQLASNEDHHARATLTRVLTTDPDRRGDVMTIALDLITSGRLDSAFGCIDVVTDAALLDGAWDRAVDGLETFVRAVPYVPALIKLVELCVDAGLDAPLREAQGRLADAYLQQGRGAEARVISEDLLDQDPASEDHARRLFLALELLGVADASSLVEKRVSRGASIDLPEASLETEKPPLEADLPMEIDLSEALAGIDAAPTRPADIVALEAAAGIPQTRFTAASKLGRLYVGRGELQAGIEWLERAAEAAAPTPNEGCAVLYDLADALDRLGESARALALLMELDADAGGYRDVRARIEQLARVQARSPGR